MVCYLKELHAVMISSAFKILIVKLLGEGQCGLVVYHSHSQLLILSRCRSSCMNLQDLLICLTGAWDATAQKDPDGRHKVRVFIAFPCAPDEWEAHVFIHLVVMVDRLLRAGHWDAFLPSSYSDRL